MGQKNDNDGNGTEDFTSKAGAPGQGPGPGDRVRVDHETGLLHVPGKGDLPLVGPTSGREYEALKRAEAKFKVDLAQLNRWRAAFWRCTQCKRVWNGGLLRIRPVEGAEVPLFICPNPKCDGPVIMLGAANSEE